MKEAVPVIDAIPSPRTVREQLAKNRREHDVLTKLLKVAEFASEQLRSTPVANERDQLTKGGRS